MQDVRAKNKQKTESTILKEWTTPDSRNTPSTTNLEKEEIVDALGNDGNASMPEYVNRRNPWRKMTMMRHIWVNSSEENSSSFHCSNVHLSHTENSLLLAT